MTTRPAISSRVRRSQSGIMMLEALIAILIFSLGILAIIGLQAQSIRNSSEAKYRADASFLASQIIGYMWADRANLAQYVHHPTGAPCAPGGATSNNGNVATWLSNVRALLPGATDNLQQINVDAATGQVTVSVCWESRTGRHNVVVSTQISG
ncbi:MAG: type IV pilus modification protein PilV [Betaproteobacteria bacterium]|nr:type IV pilus modification protein PilV [Betaproteobacteria bacterium]